MGHMSRLIETDRTRDPRDLIHFIPANQCHLTGQATTATQNAAGDYSQKRTALGAETISIGVPLFGMFRTTETADTSRNEVARGPRVNSFDVVYACSVVDMTSFTPTFKTTVFADGVAVAITDRPITGTLTLTAAATPKKKTLTVTTPIVLDSTMNAWLDLIAVLANTGVFEFWGVAVKYDLLI